MFRDLIDIFGAFGLMISSIKQNLIGAIICSTWLLWNGLLRIYGQLKKMENTNDRAPDDA